MQLSKGTGKGDGAISNVESRAVVDSHIHLDQLDADGLSSSLLDNESYAALIPGIDPAQFRALVARDDLARFDRALGWHPWYLPARDEPMDSDLEELSALFETHDPVALGEVGLDALVAEDDADEARQEAWFIAQIRLAVALERPLVVHCVRAHGRCFELLREHGAASVGGVIHAFSSSREMAEQYRSLRFGVGIGSPVSRQQSRRVREAALRCDEAWILLETDAPYMNVGTAPKGEGRVENILKIVEVVASLRQVTPAELTKQTAANYHRILKGVNP